MRKVIVAAGMMLAVSNLFTSQTEAMSMPQYVESFAKPYEAKPVTTEDSVKFVLVTKFSDVNNKDQLAKTIADAAERHDVPVMLLLSVISVESEFNPKARSKGGAIGYTQVLPKYWKHGTPYNIYSPYENIYAGAYILQTYHEELGSWDTTIKAYRVGINGNIRGREAVAYHKDVMHTMKNL